MAEETDLDDEELAGHRGTHATPRLRQFFHRLGFESVGEDE